MRVLDLFCGAGGAGMGYHNAGFEVTGVDIKPRKHNPHEFIQADALTYPLEGFDLIHASPPCQDHSIMNNFASSPRGGGNGKNTRGTGDYLAITRSRMIESGIPWVIENVRGAPMRPDYNLCGCMFDLPGLRRIRWFETSWGSGDQPGHKPHLGPPIVVLGGGTPGWWAKKYGRKMTKEERFAAMGIDWEMSSLELGEAIPPKFTEYIARQFLGERIQPSLFEEAA